MAEFLKKLFSSPSSANSENHRNNAAKTIGYHAPSASIMHSSTSTAAGALPSLTIKQEQIRHNRIQQLKTELRASIQTLQDHPPLSLLFFTTSNTINQIAHVATVPLNITMAGYTNAGGSSSIMESAAAAGVVDPVFASTSIAQATARSASVASPVSLQSPASSNAIVMQGKKARGTLWDQQYDEIALRILMEEGKINLLIRLLYRFKTLQHTHAAAEAQALTAADTNYSTQLLSPYAQLIEQCTKSQKLPNKSHLVAQLCVYESSLNTLIYLSVQHVEVLQIVDMSQFIAMCCDTLQYAVTYQQFAVYACHTAASSTALSSNIYNSSNAKLLETGVIHLIAALVSALDDLDEDNVCDLMIDRKLMPLLCTHMRSNYKWYTAATLVVCCHALNGICSSNVYSSGRTQFLPLRAEQTAFVALKGLFVEQLITQQHMRRRDIMSLSDELNRYERSVGVSITVPLVTPQ